MPPIIWSLIGLIAGAAATYGLLIFTGKNIVEQAKNEANQYRETSKIAAESKAREIALGAQEENRKRREEFNKESQATRQEIKDMEARLAKREDTLDRKLDTLSVKEKNLEDLDGRLTMRDRQVAAKELELTDILKQQREKLLYISGISADQAKVQSDYQDAQKKAEDQKKQGEADAAKKKQEAEKLGFRHARDTQDALNMALDKQGKDASVAVIRYGGHAMPVVEDERQQLSAARE